MTFESTSDYNCWRMTKTSTEAVAEAALTLFAKHGYRETSIGDIEEAAGLTRRAGGFYRHFPSKEAVLIDSVRRMAAQMTADIRLPEILAQPSVRAELMFVARKLLDHASEYRSLRLLLQREMPRMPALRQAAQNANLALARQDIVPWTKHALSRAARRDDAQTFAFVIFGPILLYLISLDRNQPAFGLGEDQALNAWADYWAAQLKPRRTR